MKSTLYLKFVIVYIIFGFLSLFTIATLGSGLVSDPLTASHRFFRSSGSEYHCNELPAAIFLWKYYAQRCSSATVRYRIASECCMLVC